MFKPQLKSARRPRAARGRPFPRFPPFVHTRRDAPGVDQRGNAIRSRRVSERLPTSLVVQLDTEPMRLVLEYVARRLGLDDGEQELVLRLSNGRLRESATGRRRIRNAELEALAARPARPVG